MDLWSNMCVYAAMTFLAGAMFCFAAYFAAPRGVVVSTRASQPVTVGGPGPTADEPDVITADNSLADALPPGRRAANIGMALLWLSLGFLIVAVALRALWAGRAPWGNMYEFSLASAAAILAVFLLFATRRDLRALGLPITVAVLLTLGVAMVLLYNDSPQLVPALNSYWLAIHVSAAIVSGGAFTVGAAASLLYLIRLRAEERGAVPAVPSSQSVWQEESVQLERFDSSQLDTGQLASGQLASERLDSAKLNSAQLNSVQVGEEKSGRTSWVSGIASRLPHSSVLDALAYRANAFVFPLWTFAIISGAIWAEDAWGRYWGWDPKETWAFVTWVLYACYLHARSTAGWRGRRAAILGLIAFAAFLINFFGVNLMGSGLHSYSGL